MRRDFFCKNCQLEQTLSSYPGQNRWAKWWFAKCSECNRKVIRYITESYLDPYMFLSPKLRAERVKYADELVQPGDPRFRILYPAQYREMQLAKAEQEQKLLADEQQKKDIYEKVCYNTADTSTRRKVREILDK